MGIIKFQELSIHDNEIDIGKAPRTLPGTHQVLCKFKLKMLVFTHVSRLHSVSVYKMSWTSLVVQW